MQDFASSSEGRADPVPSVSPDHPWTPPKPLPDRFRTARLVIRWYDQRDAATLDDSIRRSRDTLLPWLPWCKADYTKPEDAIYNIEWFRRWRDGGHDPEYQSAPGYVFGAFLQESGTLVGGTGFARLFVRTGTAEIGYWTDAAHRRKGYCAEATRGMISWGFTPREAGGWGFSRIHIFAAAANTASCAVSDSIGLRRCQYARRDRYIPGVGLADSVGWDVLPEEWDVDAQRLRAV